MFFENNLTIIVAICAKSPIIFSTNLKLRFLNGYYVAISDTKPNRVIASENLNGSFSHNPRLSPDLKSLFLWAMELYKLRP